MVQGVTDDTENGERTALGPQVTTVVAELSFHTNREGGPMRAIIASVGRNGILTRGLHDGQLALDKCDNLSRVVE